MKKLKLLIIPFFLLFFVFFQSCSVEPIDPVIASQLNNNNSTGDYFPTTIDNSWTYKQNGVTQPSLRIVGTQTFNGKLFYEFNPGQDPTGTVTVTNFLHKSGGDYLLKSGNMTVTAGGMTGTQTGYEYYILKDYLLVGETWNGTYTQTITYPSATINMNVSYTGRILDRGVSVVVNGTTYNNVIKVKIDQAVNTAGSISNFITEYWFAKDIGIVKTISSSSTGTATSELESYTLF